MLKLLLCREMSTLLKESLAIITDVPSKTNAGMRIGALNQTITAIGSLLAEYRVHEAREQLCIELTKQESELDNILNSLLE